MPGLVLPVGGGHVLALLGGVRASGMEATALGGIDRGGNVTTQHDAVHLHA